MRKQWDGFVGRAATEAQAAFQKLGWEPDPRHPLLPYGDEKPETCLKQELLWEFTGPLVALPVPPWVRTFAIDSGNGANSYGKWCLASEARSILMKWVDEVVPK